MRKKRRIKPRAEVNRELKPEMPTHVDLVDNISINVWCSDGDAKKKPEQVHVLLHKAGMPVPDCIRFKSPDTLGFLIEELIAYRKYVWGDAEPVNSDAEVILNSD